MYVKELERFKLAVQSAYIAYIAASPMIHAKSCAHDVGSIGYLILMAHMAHMATDRPATDRRPTDRRSTGDRLDWHCQHSQHLPPR